MGVFQVVIDKGIVHTETHQIDPGTCREIFTIITTADSQDVGKAREEVPIELEGEDIEIAFNARYLGEVLGIVKTETVDLELSGPLNPGVLRQTDDAEYLYVLMPMQIL